MTDVPPRTKKLDRKYLDHLAGILRPKIKDEFGGNATAFADHIDVSQPQISQLLRTDGGDRGVGIVVLMQLRKYLHMSIDDMLGLPPIQPRANSADEIVSALMVAFDKREAAQKTAKDELKGPEPQAPPSPPPPKKKRPE